MSREGVTGETSLPSTSGWVCDLTTHTAPHTNVVYLPSESGGIITTNKRDYYKIQWPYFNFSWSRNFSPVRGQLDFREVLWL